MPDDPKKKPALRSAAWFGRQDRDGFIHRSWMRNQGLPSDVFDGRPVIGICNTWSELTPCNAHFRDARRAREARRLGSRRLPARVSGDVLGETIMRPTAMLFRNLASMDVEESIRANPIDGVVLLVGCDKTTPALVMGAASCDLPAIVVSGGPMLNGKFRGQDIGSGTDVWRFSEEVRAGTMTLSANSWRPRACMSRSAGHCMTMGTASTMASMVEALGMGLPGERRDPGGRFAPLRAGAPGRPAHRRDGARGSADVEDPDARRRSRTRSASTPRSAARPTRSFICWRSPGRIGVPLTLDDLDRLGRDVPLLVDLKPSGRFLMEDFYYAGGLPAVMRELGERCSTRDALTVNGKTIWREHRRTRQCWNREVIRPFDKRR